MFEVPGQKDLEEVVVDKEVVNDGKHPVMIYATNKSKKEKAPSSKAPKKKSASSK
jgi:ATP-dependent protease Clp ATPase subunit